MGQKADTCQNYIINELRSMTDHTIDQLCPAHKSKVVELLKQLNELRKRCGILEGQIEAADLEDDRIGRMHAAINEKIDAEKHRLAEATSVATAAREQIDNLTSRQQRIETESAMLLLKTDESEQEVTLLGAKYQELRLKYDRVYADTGDFIHATSFDRESQTEFQHYSHIESQAPPPETRSEIFLGDDAFTSQAWPALTDELDAETNSLILMLNNH
jgi:chromosome segregation ATPase